MGIFRDFGFPRIDQAFKNRFGNSGVTFAGTSPGAQPIQKNNLSPFTPQQRFFSLYSGGVVVKTMIGVSFEYASPTIAQTAIHAFIAPDGDAPAGMIAWLRPAKYDWTTGITEKGNVEVIGLSPKGVPTYLFVSIAQVPSGGDKTHAGNTPVFLIWNDKYGTFDVLRIASHSARQERINSWGRMIVGRDGAGAPPFGGTLYFQWIDYAGALISPIAPFGVTGAADLQTDTFTLGSAPEVDPIGIGAGSLPTLAVADIGGTTTVTITLPTRLNVSNSFVVASQYVGGGANPGPVLFFPQLPTDQFGGNAHVSRFNFSSIDSRKLKVTAAAIAAAIAPPFPDAPVTGNFVDRNARLENLDSILVEWCAWIAPVGDDLSTF